MNIGKNLNFSQSAQSMQFHNQYTRKHDIQLTTRWSLKKQKEKKTNLVQNNSMELIQLVENRVCSVKKNPGNSEKNSGFRQLQSMQMMTIKKVRMNISELLLRCHFHRPWFISDERPADSWEINCSNDSKISSRVRDKREPASWKPSDEINHSWFTGD